MPTRRHLLLPTLTILLALGQGCSSAPRQAVLSFQSSSSGRGFSQTFPKAYFSESPDGDRTIVLIDNGYARRTTAAAGPLSPVSAPPLQQVMRFKILWSPLPGTHTDAPSTTNALMDWTIRSARPGEAGDSLRYRGAGFVQIKGDSQRIVLTIRNATIEPTGHTGSLTDPLGNCFVNGRFVAYRNDGLVQDTITDIDALPHAPPVEAASEMGGVLSNPPSRAPSAP